MAKDQRFYVNACIEIYVPDQGFGEKAMKNEQTDAEWFANEVASQIPKAINKNFEFSERPYSVVNFLNNSFGSGGSDFLTFSIYSSLTKTGCKSGSGKYL